MTAGGMRARLTLLLQVAKGKISSGQDGNGREVIYVSEERAPKSTVDTLGRLVTYGFVRHVADQYETTSEGRAVLDRNWPAWRSECPNPK